MADFFICHASEDKEAAARPLAEGLTRHGYDVWFDEYSMEVGDSLRDEIDRGLKECRFGVVILSPSFFAKPWAKKELDALVNLEALGAEKRILPVWHDLSPNDVASESPLLAGKLAALTADGIPRVIEQLVSAFKAKEYASTERRSTATRSSRKRFVVRVERRRNGGTGSGGYFWEFTPLKIVNLMEVHAVVDIILKATVGATTHYSSNGHTIAIPAAGFADPTLRFEVGATTVAACGGAGAMSGAKIRVRLTDHVSNEFENHGLWDGM